MIDSDYLDRAIRKMRFMSKRYNDAVMNHGVDGDLKILNETEQAAEAAWREAEAHAQDGLA
jgi:hypothetical protein